MCGLKVTIWLSYPQRYVDYYLYYLKKRKTNMYANSTSSKQNYIMSFHCDGYFSFCYKKKMIQTSEWRGQWWILFTYCACQLIRHRIMLKRMNVRFKLKPDRWQSDILCRYVCCICTYICYFFMRFNSTHLYEYIRLGLSWQ